MAALNGPGTFPSNNGTGRRPGRGAGKRSFDNPISDMNEPISTSTPDLAMLSRRPPPDAGKSSPGRRRWHGLLPAAIVAGFVLVFLLLFGDRLWPASEVSVIPVLAVEQAGGETAVAAPAAASDPAKLPMLFQASGWIEPDPLPTKKRRRGKKIDPKDPLGGLDI